MLATRRKLANPAPSTLFMGLDSQCRAYWLVLPLRCPSVFMSSYWPTPWTSQIMMIWPEKSLTASSRCGWEMLVVEYQLHGLRGICQMEVCVLFCVHQSDLTKEQNGFKITLKTLEDNLLSRLSSASGNFLGDTELVENLETTKRTAAEIEEKVLSFFIFTTPGIFITATPVNAYIAALGGCTVCFFVCC